MSHQRCIHESSPALHQQSIHHPSPQARLFHPNPWTALSPRIHLSKMSIPRIQYRLKHNHRTRNLIRNQGPHIHHPEVLHRAFVSAADAMHAREAWLPLGTIAGDEREREFEQERGQESGTKGNAKGKSECEREWESQLVSEKEREQLAELGVREPSEREPGGGHARGVEAFYSGIQFRESLW